MAYVWHDGRLTPLTASDGDTLWMFAPAINDRGQIVGAHVHDPAALVYTPLLWTLR